MASFFARRLRSACALSVVAVVALALPSVAAAKKASPCQTGVQTFKGGGSTLQKTAQLSVWAPDFNTSTNPAACSGAFQPKMTEWKNVGSGPGMEFWGLNKAAFNTEADFVGTDEAPNPEEKAELEKAGSPLDTIPVVQSAVASLVHLPTGCTATSTATGASGRLALGNKTLEALWAGEINTWGALIATAESKAAGDTITGSGSPTTAECEADAITRYVRAESSGTTHIWKKYLGLVSETLFEIENPVTHTAEKKSWTQISEGTLNTTWPTKAAVVNTGDTGGGALVEKVLSNPSSVGYAALSDARAKTGSTGETFKPGAQGGKGTETFWARVENGSGTYADPSTDNEESATATKSNCTNEVYTNGTKAFPPKKVIDAWNEATTSTKEPNYTICGLTFDLAFTNYGATPFGPTLGHEVEVTVGQYYRYELSTGAGGGQTEVGNGHDYEELTSQLLAIAGKGAKKLK